MSAPIHLQTSSSTVRCGAPMAPRTGEAGWDLGTATVDVSRVTCPACGGTPAPVAVCTKCAAEIVDPQLAASADELCASCAGADAAYDAEVAEAARVLVLAGPLHEVLVDVLAGVPGYETGAEVLFSALVEIARRYIVESGCDADLTAQALLENLEIPVR